MQAVLLVQLILCVKAILIVQTILILLASLVGRRQCGSGNSHHQSYDNEQKQQLFHQFLPFCDSGAELSGERQTVPQTSFCFRDAEPARQIRPSRKVPAQNELRPTANCAYLFGSTCVYNIDMQRRQLPPANLCAGRKRESGRDSSQSSADFG
jgi:hypothetical protein